MKSSLLSFIPFASFLIIAFLGFLGVPSCLADEDLFAECSNQFVCGELTATFPFWGNKRPQHCGVPALELVCEDGSTKIDINGVKYLVLGIHESTQVLEIAREDYLNGICPPGGANSTFDPVLFDVVTGYENVTLIYGCVSAVVPAPTAFTCAINGVNYQTGFVQKGANGPGECYTSVYVPVNGSALELTIASYTILLQEKLKEGFQVSWKFDSKACSECTGRVGGACGYDRSSNKTTCYCPNQSDRSSTCSSSPVAAPTDPARSDGKPSSKVPIGVGIGIAGAVVVGAFLGIWFFVIIRRRKRTFLRMQSGDTSTPPSSKGLAAPQPKLSQSTPSYPSAKSDLGKGSTYFGVQMFEYSELEEATDGFNPSRELGDGGFGIVYYGVLKDGRAVAVKRLYDNNGRRAEQFMNEVEILARLRHKNLVTLFGCTSRRSQELLLVYEYIPNGTVADHLHGRRSNSVLLPWPVRLSIAIETADALAYLHGVDVIHRDVKTNNILLDNNFSVKVADFGLSRLFPTNATHVSTAPQGTPGYVDPEYFECYQLTDKSDVYSFGVVLIELISSLQAVDTTRHRLDINLGSMAINKIQNHALNELVDPSLGFEKDHAVRSMVISVAELAFRCLQQERDMRPTMAEALAALRRIQNENYGAEKVLVVDVREDDVGLLKHTPLPLVLSPDTLTEKWASDSTLPTTDSSSA